jgi:hypothetical protein
LNNYNSGEHDPYWYEAFVGLKYVLKMLDTDSGIEAVAFQARTINKLDDVVVKYKDGRSLCIQVKHTRSENNLTLSDLIRPSGGSSSSLLQDMAFAWKEGLKTIPNCIPELYTNRRGGKNWSRTANDSAYPPLPEFWKALRKELRQAGNLSGIRLESTYSTAWTDLLAQLGVLETDIKKYEFLRKLRLRFSRPDLEKLESQMHEQIGRIFGVSSPSFQREIFEKLAASLRFWTTSIQGKVDFVFPEEVYSRLSFQAEVDDRDHLIRPPVPFLKSRLVFMERLIEQLGSRKHSIIFLKGSPGSGKSSLISQLAYETPTIINLRYHAFKPITPEIKEIPPDAGRTVDPRVFWTASIDQIRVKFTGKLYQYKVPIRCDYLTVDEIRSHTLRLAQELSNINHRPTVIAVDGIDHAARAGYISHKHEDTFLLWLVHPEEVPSGILFLLAGQPPEGYPAYPQWLKEDSSEVLHLEVPVVTESDIRQMLSHDFPGEFIEPAVNVIHENAVDNTLAAVFAVREAKGCTTVEELIERLRARKLHDGIHAYYDHIWIHALQKIQTKVNHEIAYLNEKLSSYFSLSSERLDGATLKGIFKELLLTESDWNYLLKDLEPLVVEQDRGKFVLFHNDVRVYFMRYIRNHHSILEDIAGSLADFYVAEPSYKIARHADLFSLLRQSGRIEEIISIFNPSFIMEAWTIRRPIDEIKEQCRDMLAVVKKRKNWNDAGGVLEALRTVQQLLTSYEKANERNYFVSEDQRVPAFVPSEGIMKPPQTWKMHLLNQVFNDVRRLVKLGEYDRARQIMERWFKQNNVTPFQLIDLLEEYYVFESSFDRDNLGKGFLELIREWGELAGITLIYEWRIKKEEVRNSLEEQVASAYSDGFLHGSLNRSGFSFFRCLKRYLQHLVPEKREVLVERMVDEQKWTELRYILKRTDHLVPSFQHRIKLAMYSAIANFETERFVRPVVEQGYDILEHKKMNYETDAKLYSCICFLRGWAYPESDLKQQAEEAIQVYFSYDRDPRTTEMIRLLLHSTYRMGAYYCLSMQEGYRLSKQDITMILYLLERLYLMDQSVYYHLVGYIEVRSFFMRMTMFLSRNDKTLDKLLYPVVRDSMIEGDIFYLDMELIWGFLDSHGDQTSMELIFQRWTNEKGIIWDDNLQKATLWVEKLAALGEKYQLQEKARHLKEQFARKWFGITARQSSLNHVVQWVEILLNEKPSLWKGQGKLLLDLCRQLDSESNLVADYAVSVVMAAAQKDGVEILWAVLNETGMLDVDDFSKYKATFDVLIRVLRNTFFTEEDLVALWILTVGGMSWRERSSRAYIEDMRKCILKAAHRLGYSGLGAYMKHSTPYHFDIHNNRDRDNRPKRWFITSRERRPYWESTWKRVERKIKKLSTEEAFDDFKRVINNLDPHGGSMDHVAAFNYAEILVRKLSTEPSYRNKEYTNILFEFAETHAVASYHRNDQYIQDFYSAIIDFTTDDKTRWRVLDSLLPESIDNRELSYFIVKLEEMLQARAVKLGAKEIEDATIRILNTYKQWLDWNVDMTSAIYSSSHPLNRMSWRQFTLNILLRNLSSNNEHQIEAVLQGLWQFIQWDHTVIYDLISRWEDVENSGQGWLLIIFERIAVTYPSYYEAMKPLLTELKSSGGLQISTQAEVINETFVRWQYIVSGKSKPWVIQKLGAFISRFTHGNERKGVRIIDYPPFQDRHFNQRFYQIASIFPDLVNELLDEMEASGDSNFNPEKKLLDIIEKRIEKETWERTSLYNEVQAYLPCDDPFLLLDTPRAFRSSTGWLKLGLMAMSKFDPEDACLQFMKQARKGMRDGQELLGAALFHFNIVEGYYFTCGLSESLDISRPTASGRSFLFYNNVVNSRKSNPDLFYTFNHINGQKIPYSSTVLLVPSPIFRSLGWHPSTMNPLVWEKKGKKMMWMEQIFGPFEEGVHPFLQRWVCTKEGFVEITRVKRNLRYMVTFEPMRNNVSMMDLPNNVRVFM